ncbi:unnamed protein product [Orchesella dallaii]|uniref:UDP-N-acetylglucosamine transferase subunit ALG13 n=1 Tax=Orchesella dallaii TaxID=48710 RepID=A0ABP1QIA1_9HEXA
MFERVFVTVGTTSFQQLIQLIVSDKVVDQFSKWGVKEVRIQGGKNNIDRDSNEWVERDIKYSLYEYKPTIDEDIQWADIIISHAGAGTTLEALDQGKVLLVVPNETLMDNHQLELAKKLEKENYAFMATIDTFCKQMEDIDPSVLKPFPPARPELLANYLAQMNIPNKKSKLNRTKTE